MSDTGTDTGTDRGGSVFWLFAASRCARRGRAARRLSGAPVAVSKQAERLLMRLEARIDRLALQRQDTVHRSHEREREYSKSKLFRQCLHKLDMDEVYAKS